MIVRAAGFLALVLLASAGCRRKAPAPPEDALRRFALSVVEAARGPGGIGAELVDDRLVEDVRRLQLVKAVARTTRESDRLLAALRGEVGPDGKPGKAEAPGRQRERASRGIRENMTGPCRATRWDGGLAERLDFLVGPLPGARPKEVVLAEGDLAKRLAGAELARVTCEKGDLGLLAVKGPGGSRRVVDLFPIVGSAAEVRPEEPERR